MEPWETVRKIVAGLPATPQQGVKYGFHCQEGDAPDLQVSGARRPPGARPRVPEKEAVKLSAMDDMTFLRFPMVMRLTGLKKTTIYEMMHKQIFPQAMKLGARAIAWRAGDIRAWIQARQPAYNP